MLRPLVFLLTLGYSLVSAASTVFPVSAVDSYLNNVGNLSTGATVIPLAGTGGGIPSAVRLAPVGEYSFAGSEALPNAPLTQSLIGVFSASDTLRPIDILAPSGLLRVVDALDAGQDVTTAEDIAEDFIIDGQVIMVPDGAAFLFVAPFDGFVGDNHDDDMDLGEISRYNCEYMYYNFSGIENRIIPLLAGWFMIGNYNN